MNSKFKQNSWKEIWREKGCISFDEITLQQLLTINGCDTVTGKVSVESWISYVESTKVKLNINETKNILEVGCGAGAFILPLYKKGVTVSGLDYSENQIKICTHIMPSGTFKVSEANKIPYESEIFDAVVSNGVFIYFRDLDYAENVVREIARVLKYTGRAAILDINDEKKKDAFESLRRIRLGDKQYNKLYGNLTHQYYSKRWFEEVAKRYGLCCQIQEQHLSGYDNSEFRFNVFLEKN